MSKVSIQFLLFFRQSGNVLLFLYARRLRGYTATETKFTVVLDIGKSSLTVKVEEWIIEGSRPV